jgi:hypothetical protein
MLGSDRLAATVRQQRQSLGMACRHLTGHKRSLAYVGTALALAGAGSAAGTATASAADTPLTSAAHAQPPRPLQATDAAASIVVPASGTGRLPAVLPAAGAHRGATAKPASPARPASSRRPAARTWKQVQERLSRESRFGAARHGTMPLADRLMPASVSGPQAWMPIDRAQVANATTIVRQALRRRMGVRSAVIAVATAMQESRLLNISYGDANSLGLFQQRPGFGWGSAREILDPEHSANAFLSALHRLQSADPAWARQPLWATAQAVQRSGFPFAYAKWETQAANLVRQIAMSPAVTG